MIAECVFLLVLGCQGGAEGQAVVRWDFDTEDSASFQAVGNVQRDQPGPRPPEYPGFNSDNTAVRLDGKGARLVLENPPKGGPFDFSNGDAITLEAWVQLTHLGRGGNPYVIGKGRTGGTGFSKDNQNWALRLREKDGLACVNFLFATPKSESGAADSHWHRFTTTEGFRPGTRWHHIAVAYEFGKPGSIKAWLDGKLCPGRWDMGGATVEGPVVDRDSVWIGSSQSGLSGSSFTGSLDAVAVHRGILPDQALATRFRRVGADQSEAPAPEKMPEMGIIPPGKVLVSVHEGATAQDRWLVLGEEFSAPTVSLALNHALFDRLPLRYDSWGIRDEWNAPVLVRMAADLSLPVGSHTLLARVRGLSRLWVDGKVIGRGGPLKGSPSGEEPITPVAEAPIPGARVAEHRQQEIYSTVEVASPTQYRVVLETLVGGRQFRADPGETLLAVRKGGAARYQLLGDQAIPLEDGPVNDALAANEMAMAISDDQNRRRLGESRKPFWSMRHEKARQMVLDIRSKNERAGLVHEKSVDAFIDQKVKNATSGKVAKQSSENDWVRDKILPILQADCIRCHGEKNKGGLRLDSRAAATLGGDSGKKAVVPGNPESSELMRRVKSTQQKERMPPGHSLDPSKVRLLEAWIRSGAPWVEQVGTAEPSVAMPVLNDHGFARRVYLDTVGVPPTEKELDEFARDGKPDKRSRLIDRLLADDRHADRWMGYWQDVLAENPTLLNASLNTTGPFRWFLHEAFRDRKGVDQWVSELIQLRGGRHDGGSAAFGLASENDTPFAVKAQILGSAFLGIEMQCAKCHDAPFHDIKQKDLFSLAAFLEGKPVPVPASSRVPAAFFETDKSRRPLIRVSLQGDEPIPPAWPFEAATGCKDSPALNEYLEYSADGRSRLGALITSPLNKRFPRVVVNRVWRRLMGAGLVEPPGDWEGRAPSHPALLDWLADELVANNYDTVHIERLILNSSAYQREANGKNLAAPPQARFFNAPDRRRLDAEQIVDSMHAVAGVPMDVEELCFDPDGRRPASNRLGLGKPRRAWMLASLANERDRPSLTLPKARMVADLLEAFGWNGARQFPKTDRDTEVNVMQPGAMANSSLAVLLCRPVPGSGLARLALESSSPGELVDGLFLRILSRMPSPIEKDLLVENLRSGFESRVVAAKPDNQRPMDAALPKVTWSNHLRPESSRIGLQLEERAKKGVAADPRLSPDWRDRFEDAVWSLMNLPEFVWVP